MIIRTSKSLKRCNNEVVVKQEEVKTLDHEVIQKPKKKKNIPTPVIEEPIVEVVEEKIEDEDLSKWLEEHTED